MPGRRLPLHLRRATDREAVAEFATHQVQPLDVLRQVAVLLADGRLLLLDHEIFLVWLRILRPHALQLSDDFLVHLVQVRLLVTVLLVVARHLLEHHLELALRVQHRREVGEPPLQLLLALVLKLIPALLEGHFALHVDDLAAEHLSLALQHVAIGL